MAQTRLITAFTTLIAILFTTLFPAVASADILRFGPGALPNCAYRCTPLYSAQYDCPDETNAGVAGQCFCRSKYLEILQGNGGSLCEADCPETGGGAEIRAWYTSVCSSILNQQPTTTTSGSPTTSTNSQNPKDTSDIVNHGSNNETSSGDNTSQELRAIEWWKKNWYWFLLAFLLITVPIVAYALWFPCRKWARNQIIKRRARPSLPPVAPFDDPYANGGLASPGIPPVPPGAFANQQWGLPFSPSLTRDGTGYIPHYIAPPTPSPLPSVRPTPVPVGPVNVRQSSWERRVRGEYEGKRTIGERLAFWKRGARSVDEEDKVNTA